VDARQVRAAEENQKRERLREGIAAQLLARQYENDERKEKLYINAHKRRIRRNATTIADADPDPTDRAAAMRARRAELLRQIEECQRARAREVQEERERERQKVAVTAREIEREQIQQKIARAVSKERAEKDLQIARAARKKQMVALNLDIA
jgi:hypothetical protein